MNPLSFENFRIALLVVYLAALAWKAIAGTMDDFYWYIGGFIVVRQLSYGVERLWWRWRVRRLVAFYRALDPARREQLLDRMWSRAASNELRDALAAHGATGGHEATDSADGGGMVERYPFSPVDRRENALLTTAIIVIGFGLAALQLSLRLPAPVAVVLLGLSVAVVFALGWLIRRGRELGTVLEVSRFNIAELRGGERIRGIAWNQPLVLRNRRLLGRVELTAPAAARTIPLGYARVGFLGLLARVVEYGGFQVAAGEPHEDGEK